MIPFSGSVNPITLPNQAFFTSQYPYIVILMSYPANVRPNSVKPEDDSASHFIAENTNLLYIAKIIT
jgi:hypothetical protein